MSAIIKVLNERFGLQLTNFRLVFADAFMKTIVRRMDGNAEIFQRILDDRGDGLARV